MQATIKRVTLRTADVTVSYCKEKVFSLVRITSLCRPRQRYSTRAPMVVLSLCTCQAFPGPLLLLSDNNHSSAMSIGVLWTVLLGTVRAVPS